MALLYLGLVSGYYKVMRKRNNHKALVLRGWNEQKDREKKKRKYSFRKRIDLVNAYAGTIKDFYSVISRK